MITVDELDQITACELMCLRTIPENSRLGMTLYPILARAMSRARLTVFAWMIMGEGSQVPSLGAGAPFGTLFLFKEEAEAAMDQLTDTERKYCTPTRVAVRIEPADEQEHD